MGTYAAFLRGINSGLNPTTKMDILKKAFEDLGFGNVKTVIASGNVIFDADDADEKDLEQTLEKEFSKAIGFESATIVYKLTDLKGLAKLDAFKGVKTSPTTRLFVTFVEKLPKSSQRLSGNGFEVIKRSGRALFSVLHLAGTTPDLMKVPDKEFGKTNTTRSWKTIEKIIQKAKG